MRAVGVGNEPELELGVGKDETAGRGVVCGFLVKLDRFGGNLVV
jgi:hypothetical protein